MLEEKAVDYSAMIIRGAAGVVIFISLSLILLVVGNMIYTTFTDQSTSYKERSSKFDYIYSYSSITQLSLQSARSRGSPFCPCFSPTISDESESDHEDDPPGVSSETVAASAPIDCQQSAVESQLLPAESLTSRLHNIHLNREDREVSIHRIVEYSNHLVPDVYKIYAASYYWGIMDRFRAEDLLENKPEGTFLLRDSAQAGYLFSVSFRRYQRTLHARIEQGSHRFGFDILDTSMFSAPSVTELIVNYKDPTKCLFFEPQLTHPLHRDTVFSLQTLRCGIRRVISEGFIARQVSSEIDPENGHGSCAACLNDSKSPVKQQLQIYLALEVRPTVAQVDQAEVTGSWLEYRVKQDCPISHSIYNGHLFVVEQPKELCRGYITRGISYGDVSKLPLPQRLKGFVSHYHYTVPVRTVNVNDY